MGMALMVAIVQIKQSFGKVLFFALVKPTKAMEQHPKRNDNRAFHI